LGENSKIEWCHHTFNPWRGCSNVSPGCDHCYAERSSKRNPKVLGVWGDDGTRVIASEVYWRKPFAWNDRAAAAGELRPVLEDIGERRAEHAVALEETRERLFDLIDSTPHLDWLLLTKRPKNGQRMLTTLSKDWLPEEWPLPNVWLGVSAEDQDRADERIPILLDTPAAVRFVSYEPALGPVDFRPYIDPRGGTTVDWVIVGGESGPAARPFDVMWAHMVIDQCLVEGGPAVFVKQLGSYYLDLRDRKGGDPGEWPEGLRVRQLPGSVLA